MQDEKMAFTFSETNQQQIRSVVDNDGVFAYPTEAVFGLGCDPFSEDAVSKLLAIKQRPVEQGLIIIASQWHQVSDLILSVPANVLEQAYGTWPGPVTWLFPARPSTPKWLTGDHNSIAIRMTAHPIALAICEVVDQAIVSTSANFAGQPPCKTEQEVADTFTDQLDLIIPGLVGDLENPTEIRDVLSGEIVRQ